MGIQVIGASGDIAEVGNRAYNAAAPVHTQVKPLSYSTLGHYRLSTRFTMTAAQAVNSRLWEVRNPHATNLIVPTRLRAIVLPAGTVTTAYRMELDLFKLTGFTVSSTANAVTPGVPSAKRASMAGTPIAVVRSLTAAGAAAGMTGATSTKDASAAAIMDCWAATASASTLPIIQELLDDVNGTHPWVLGQNEGLEIENVVAGSATANVVDVAIDFSWAEVTAF